MEQSEIHLLLKLTKVLAKKQSIQELYSTLESYIKFSKKGTYKIRCQILDYVKDFYPKYSGLIKSILSFYSTFNESFDNNYESQKKAANKEIRECEILVGWDSSNFHVLRQTVEKFHKKLYKIGKEFKDYLDETFEQIIISYQNKQLFECVESLSHALQTPDPEIQEIKYNIKFTENVQKTAKKLLDLPLPEINVEFQEMTQTIFDRMKNLQNEGTTKLMKQRAVVDLFKSFKEIGLSSFYKSLISESLIINSLPDIQVQSNLQPLWFKIKNYYYKLIERIHYIQSHSDYHQDLKDHSIKAIGFICENFLTSKKLIQILGERPNQKVPQQKFNEDKKPLIEFTWKIKQLTQISRNENLNLLYSLCFELLKLLDKKMNKDEWTQAQKYAQQILKLKITNQKLQAQIPQIPESIKVLVESPFEANFELSLEQQQVMVQQHNLFLTNLQQTEDKSQLAAFKDQLSQFSQLRRIPATNGVLIPLLQKSEETIESYFINTLYQLLKLNYISTCILTNILFKGFCQIDEDDDNQGQGQGGEGMGVGKGKGQENKSKEMEFDEQMAGLKGEDDEDEEEEGEYDFNDDAYDMDQDFEGQTKEKEKNKDGEENEEENDDPEEQMSQVDDQVDHKMWDEGAEEQEKEEKDREMDDLDMKGEQKGETEERAKQEEKAKDEQRNLKDFEDISQEANEKEHQDMEEEEQEEMEDNDQRDVQNNPQEQVESQSDNDMSIKFSEQGQFSDGDEDQDDQNEPFEDNLENEEKDEVDKQSIEPDNFDKINEELENNMEEENNEEELNPMVDQKQQNEQQNQDEGIKDGQDAQIEQNEQGEQNQENKNDQTQQNQGDQGQQPQDQNQSTFSQDFIQQIMDKIQQIEKEQIDQVIQEKQIQNQDNQNEQEIQANQNHQEFETTQQQQAQTAQLATKDQENRMDIEEIQEQEKKQEGNQGQKNDEINQQSETQQEQQKQQDNQKMEEEVQDKNQEFNPTSNQNFKKIQDGNQIEMEIEEETTIKLKLESQQDYEKEKQDLEKLVKDFQLSTPQESLQKWREMEQETRAQSQQLCEELKSVLEATKISQFRGDYKSGKRLNMKKIIPFIASNFRKDKIWLRRTQPNNRNYQIMIAIDDSLSMQEHDYGYFALKSSIVLGLAMSKAEVGKICIAGIQNGLKLVHDFEVPFNASQGPYVLDQFNFQYSDKNSADLSIPQFMKDSIELFKSKNASNDPDHQICFIISDGFLNKKLVKPLVQEGEENNILYIFIILDQKDKIMNIKSVQQQKDLYGKTQMKMNLYLEDFPFKHYIVIKEMHELSKVLVEILRQYFEMKKN